MAGYLQVIDGVSVANIARWDGTTWTPLETGLNGYATDLIAVGSDVFVAGTFTTAGGVASRGVAKWDGSSWSALGSALNGSAYSIQEVSGNIYVGGDFSSAGGVAGTRHIAKWDGSSWSSVGGGGAGYGQVFHIASVGDDIVIAGNFTEMGGKGVNNIARWDGTNWKGVGDDLDGVVNAAYMWGGELYVGGTFTTIGGISANRIAKWDGRQWHAISSGANGTVYKISEYQGNLLVVGSFTEFAGQSLTGIATYDGASWDTVGGGKSNVISATSSGSDFYVLSNNAPYFWDGSAWVSRGSSAYFNRPNDIEIFKNELYVSHYGGLRKWVDDGSAQGSWSTVSSETFGTRIRTSSDHLYVGLGSKVIRYDGTNQESLMLGGYKFFEDTHFFQDELYGVGRNIDLTKWDGSQWSPVSANSYAGYNVVLASDADAMYAAGYQVERYSKYGIANQGSGTKLSVVYDGSAISIFYIDSAGVIKSKSISGAPLTWGSETTIHMGNATSVSASFLTDNGTMIVWFVEDGLVKYREATSPYTDWSSAVIAGTNGHSKNIATTRTTSSSANPALALWNRARETNSADVVASMGTPEPTWTYTPTNTPTSTPTSTPTNTPTNTPTSTPTSTQTPTATSMAPPFNGDPISDKTPNPGEENPRTGSLRGVVQLSNGTPLPGTMIIAPHLGLTNTNAEGVYEFKQALEGETYAVAPRRMNYEFEHEMYGVRVNEVKIIVGDRIAAEDNTCQIESLQGGLQEISAIAAKLHQLVSTDHQLLRKSRKKSVSQQSYRGRADDNYVYSLLNISRMPTYSRICDASSESSEQDCDTEYVLGQQTELLRNIQGLRRTALLFNRKTRLQGLKSAKKSTRTVARIRRLNRQLKRKTRNMPSQNVRGCL